MRKIYLRVFFGLLTITFMCRSVSYAGTTVAVSVDSDGNMGNDFSNEPAISADGRYVAFHSKASNLVPDDTNGKADIFVHDRQTGETTIISKNNVGNFGNDHSDDPAISADGRYVAFRSVAGNLVPDDTNGKADIFLHDRQTGETMIISKDNAGRSVNNDSSAPAISADGRYVAFQSLAGNLVPGDTNDHMDIFIHDRQTGKTKIISKNSAGNPGNNHSYEPAISSDGRYAAFQSGASNLVAGDRNDREDIFVHDRKTNAITIISRGRNGSSANGPSSLPAISADGRYVTFESQASNLVPGDVNGKPDAFVHDRQTGRTRIISVNSDGILGNNGGCFIPSISADGRYVAFESESSNLVPGDNNGKTDVFVHDLHKMTSPPRR